MLLEVLYIADWILNAHKTREDTEIDRYKELEQKILSHVKDFGLENFVEWDPNYHEYHYTREFEERSPAMEFIEEFEDETFWDELINRLRMQDLIEKYGNKLFRKWTYIPGLRRKRGLQQIILQNLRKTGCKM